MKTAPSGSPKGENWAKPQRNNEELIMARSGKNAKRAKNEKYPVLPLKRDGVRWQPESNLG
jgi:hypothetical protein